MYLRSKAAALAAGAALVMAGLTACGEDPAASASGLLAGTYVGTDYNSVTMLQLSHKGGDEYTGTLDTVTQGQSPVNGVALSATLSGDQLTLTDSLLGTVGSTTATVKNGVIHLQAPQDDGTVEDYVLRRSSVTGYNREVQEQAQPATQ